MHITSYLLLQGRTVLSHDYVFWCGDFNYRINMERDQVIDMVNKKVTTWWISYLNIFRNSLFYAA